MLELTKTGFLTAIQLKSAGYSSADIAKSLKSGALQRLTYGVYFATESGGDVEDFEDDEMLNTSLRFPQTVFTHDTALYLYELNDRCPIRYSVAVPTGYNTKKLYAEDFKIFAVKPELHGQDIVEMKTIFGNYVRAYDLERTICDCLRSKKRLETEIVLNGLKRYVRMPERKLSKLLRMSEKLKIDKLLKTYLEVLL